MNLTMRRLAEQPEPMIRQGRVLTATPTHVTFELAGQPNKRYGPATYTPLLPRTVKDGNSHSHTQPLPTTGQPIIALFYGVGLTDVHVIPIEIGSEGGGA